ncbi:hypothetical protein TNCV_433371 [Trichonephila clavipes]|nr:hypothetical protein TNCV_433371 [Trichonephila clavipes]
MFGLFLGDETADNNMENNMVESIGFILDNYPDWRRMYEQKQSTQQLETRTDYEETQEESIRTSPQSVVANETALARGRN